MALFLSTFINKVDKKGRVSVPARYRAVLSESGRGVIVFPSYTVPAIEACGEDFMEGLQERLGGFDPFSQERDDLALAIMSDSYELNLDGEGRIMLPEPLLSHAGISDSAAFVGQGDRFQIWEPEAAERYKHEARRRALQHRGRLTAGETTGGGR